MMDMNGLKLKQLRKFLLHPCHQMQEHGGVEPA
jgi:hypothetical protein